MQRVMANDRTCLDPTPYYSHFLSTIPIPVHIPMNSVYDSHPQGIPGFEKISLETLRHLVTFKSRYSAAPKAYTTSSRFHTIWYIRQNRPHRNFGLRSATTTVHCANKNSCATVHFPLPNSQYGLWSSLFVAHRFIYRVPQTHSG